jgi:hypothetical protein
VVSSHVIIEQDHRWVSPRELLDALTGGIRRVPEYAAEVAAEMRGWRGIPVDDPVLTFQRIGERAGIPQYALNDAEEFWRNDGSEHNMFAVTQALAHGTKRLTENIPQGGRLSWDRRNRLERAILQTGIEVREHGGVGELFACPACHRPLEAEDGNS